jgi:agmatinase
MIDPLARWRDVGTKPDFAGLLSFGGLPYTEDPAELTEADVAIVGAPSDDLVSNRPGARLAPRAIRAAGGTTGAHLEARVDGLSELRAVDFGDAPVRPADATATHAAIERTVGQVLDADAVPIVLGGDHGISEPNIRACAVRHGRLGLVHFDAHTDTARTVLGVRRSHGTPMYRLIEEGHLDPARYVQIGLRGYWPEEETFAWQRDRGITSFFIGDVRERGIAEVLDRATEIIGTGPAFLSADVDVLDPSVAPGTGTPEPGGLGASELLLACREAARRLSLVGADVVEVIPTPTEGTDITALIADRLVREIATGLAISRRSQSGDR